jgi:imidazolonepropionase-like amidohydrolase
MMKKIILICFSLQVYCLAYPQDTTSIVEQGTYLVHRRQFLIGEENYTITKSGNLLVINSSSKELDRGSNSIVKGELRMKADMTPIHYVLNKEITGVSVPSTKDLSVEIKNGEATITEEGLTRKMLVGNSFFTAHSLMPTAMEMMLIRYWIYHKLKGKLQVIAAESRVSIIHRGKDLVQIHGKNILLDRYIVRGVSWGIQTVWMDSKMQLIALMRSNRTAFQEMILKGYEDGLSFFVSKAVEEQMAVLTAFTKSLRQKQPEFLALVGGDLIDGTGSAMQKDVTIIIKRDKIISISSRSKTIIPKGAKVINVTGKTLTAGLWDMHVHANQVDWSPAYLAAGVTTIRDLGNEIEFATAFRDAINSGKAIGPEILLAGMTDGAGEAGNGIIRATTPEEVRQVVNMYRNKGYLQIKIYDSFKPELVKVIAEEAHKLGMTVTGHVPRGISTIESVENGMDQINHASDFLSSMLPNAKEIKFGKRFTRISEVDLKSDDVKNGIQLFLKHNTILDPTISVYALRNHAQNMPIEIMEPGITKLPAELYEVKASQPGVSGKYYDTTKIAMDKALALIGMLHKAGVTIVAGSDNGVPVHSLYLELELYVKAGFTPLEAIQSATIVPATVMKRDKETGTIEAGKRADIAIFDSNPLENISSIRSVSAVISRGYYYQSAPLWKSVGFKP